MSSRQKKHWSKVEYLHQTVTNPNIHVKGTHSYYSNAWTSNFENSVVRYLYGDAISLKNWKPQWKIDQLYIGDYVCIGAEVIILLGGNHTHKVDWFSLYPFADKCIEAYESRGDTVIHDGAWIGLRSIIMPGVDIGEGAIVATNAVVTKNVAPYTIVAGSPAKVVKRRFSEDTTNRLLSLKVYDWSKEKFNRLKDYLCSNDIDALENASRE